MSERFEDPRHDVDTFADEGVLVVCPRCGACALSRPVSAGGPSLRRLACRHCGYCQDWRSGFSARRWADAEDPHFAQPLWLQAPCCGEVLSAYNLPHLDFLERFIRADLRERERDPKWGWSNKSLVSRLPLWMKSAKNREEILRVIALLRGRADAA